MLHRTLYIFPIFRAICEYYVNKNLPPLLRTIRWAIFSYFATNQSVAQQVRDTSMLTNGNQKRPSLVSKPHGVELRSRVLPTCREPVLPYVMNHCYKEKRLYVASFGILTLFQAGNGSNRSIVVDRFNWFIINRFPQVSTAHNRPRPSSPTKHRTSSFCQSDSITRSMWMYRLGLPMISCARNSQNKSNFHHL